MRLSLQAVGLKDPSLILSGPDDTLESHMIVFAAEAARKERRCVSLCVLRCRASVFPCSHDLLSCVLLIAVLPLLQSD